MKRIVGIVPLAKRHSIHNKLWDDGLIDVREGLNAIQAAIVECASVGCDSIWVNADYEQIPLLKRLVGSWVEDPTWFYRKHDPRPKTSKKLIPIFYSWNHQKDVGRRDSHGWGILNAATVACKVANNVSRHLVPELFYVSSPFAITDIWQPKHLRTEIKTSDRFCFSYNGETFLDNKMLSFVFNRDDLLAARKNVRQKGTGMKFFPDGFENEPVFLPIEERWSARFFEIGDIFSFLTKKDFQVQETEVYYPIDSWEGYVDYMRSDLPTKPFKSKYFYNRGMERIRGYERNGPEPDYSQSEEDE